MSRAKQIVLLLLLFIVHVLPFANRPRLIGGDEPHYALMAHSIAVDRDLDLSDDYHEVALGSPAAGAAWAGVELDRHVGDRGGRESFLHPIGLPVLASPIIAALQTIRPGAPPDVALGLIGLGTTFLGLLAGRNLLARATGCERTANTLAFSLLYSTPLWYYGRTFFVEPYLWSFAVIALWFVAKESWISASIVIGLLFPLKETGILIAGPLLAYIAFAHGLRRGAQCSIFPIFLFLLWAIKNLMMYGNPLTTFQEFQFGDLLQGAFGLCFDPSTGLFLFAPILALALFGWTIRPDDTRRWRLPISLSVLTFVSVFLVSASWKVWQGGSCYGPRLLLPAIPAFAIPLTMAWKHWRASRLWRWGFFVLTVIGVGIQLTAVSHPVDAFWSISVFQLVARFPFYFGVGVLFGGCVLYALNRFGTDSSPRSSPRQAMETGLP